jgi:AcrR family transcriptional regulator
VATVIARKRPTGRRAGDSGTRDAILDAALACFSERGFEGASLRAIAADAGVDPALIRHFFGDKERLFATVVADRTSVYERLAAALPGDTRGRGRRVTDTYLGLWEARDTGPVLMAVARSAMTSENAARMLRDALGGKVRAQVGDLDAAHSQRLAIAGAHLFGVAVARHILKVPAIAELEHEDLVAHVAPTIQRYLRT